MKCKKKKCMEPTSYIAFYFVGEKSKGFQNFRCDMNLYLRNILFVMLLQHLMTFILVL